MSAFLRTKQAAAIVLIILIIAAAWTHYAVVQPRC